MCRARASGARVARAVLCAAALAAPLAAGPVACSRGEGRSLGDGARGAAPPDPLVGDVSSPYRVTAVTAGGALAGTVELSGDAPPDTVVRPTYDQRVCGASFVDVAVPRNGRRLADVVVWLADARAGKPLPVERRFEVSNEDCRIVPRVQAALVGGTLNVRSGDRVSHRDRFLRPGASSAAALVSENDDGQVVPLDNVLVRPGRLEIRCDVHPWTRGWVWAFDHPYYAVTGRDGTFRIDSVPPGTYRLVAWQERLGTVEQRVDVAAGKTAEIKLTLGPNK